MSCPVRQVLPGAPAPGTLPALALAPGQAGPLVASLLPWLEGGRRAYCLDGGNCFSPYPLASAARARGLDPAPLLERVFVSRAYTCHQLLEAVATMLAPLAERPEPPLALILGIDRLFLDDDISLDERRRIFGRLVARAARLRERLPLLITHANAECGMRNAELSFIYAPFRFQTLQPGRIAEPIPVFQEVRFSLSPAFRSPLQGSEITVPTDPGLRCFRGTVHALRLGQSP